MEKNIYRKEGQLNNSQKDVNSRESLRIKTAIKASSISNTKKTIKLSRIQKNKESNRIS